LDRLLPIRRLVLWKISFGEDGRRQDDKRSEEFGRQKGRRMNAGFAEGKEMGTPANRPTFARYRNTPMDNRQTDAANEGLVDGGLRRDGSTSETGGGTRLDKSDCGGTRPMRVELGNCIDWC
jgi:hypothetical protein